MDKILVIANIISGLGTFLMFLSTFQKDKDSMLKLSILDFSCNTIANFLIKGYSAMVINLLGGIREVLTLKGKITNKLIAFFVASSTIIALIINNQGLIGLIPIIAEIEYNIGASKVKTGIGYQIILSINFAIWIIYCLSVKLYTTAIFYFIIIISSIINIIKNKKRED